MAVTMFSLEEEYKKNKDISHKEVRMLREWLKSQPHLPAEQISDLDLILMFYSCNNSFSVTKQVIDLHYTLRTHMDAFFKDRVVNERVVKSFECLTAALLPVRSTAGYACLYMTLVDADPAKFIQCDLHRLALMLIELSQYEEGTWPGLIFILDFRLMQFAHLATADLFLLQKFFFYLQEAMPVKFKGMHFINVPSYIDRLVMMIRPILKKEIMDTLKIHQPNTRTLDEYFPIEALPKEAGGSSRTIPELKDITLNKLLANKEFFEKMDLKRVDESKRPGKPKSLVDFFGGVDGSFKKLDID